MSPDSLAVVGVLPCVLVKSYFKIVYVYLDMREITEAYVMVLRASQMWKGNENWRSLEKTDLNSF